jgi:hypothetical protein
VAEKDLSQRSGRQAFAGAAWAYEQERMGQSIRSEQAFEMGHRRGLTHDVFKSRHR